MWHPFWGDLVQLHCQLIIYNSNHEHCFDLQGSDTKKQKTEPVLVQRKGAVASAFNDEVHNISLKWSGLKYRGFAV